MPSRRPKKLLEIGDVLKTNPVDGYWGCALVLSVRGKTEEFDPMCHIAVTSTVFRRDYELSDLDVPTLAILEFDRQARVGPNEYVPLRHETAIGIYARKHTDAVNVVGNIDVSFITPDPLTFDVGNGSDGGWPLCGPVEKSLGYEAVHAWRAVHDRENWLADIDAARKSHEALMERLAEERRSKRKKG